MRRSHRSAGTRSAGRVRRTLALVSMAVPLAISVSAQAADVTGTITIGGSPLTVTISNAGDNARITFSGTAGQRISLNLTNVSITMSDVSIQNPDGSNLVAPTAFFTSGKFVDTKTLTQTGTHTIVIDPYSAYTGSVTLTLYEVAADVTGSITPGGSPVSVSLSSPGQNARLSFSGSAGQRVAVRVSSNSIPSSIVQLRSPTESLLGSTGLIGATDSFIDTKTFDAAGTHSVFLDPQDAHTGNVTITAYDVPADVSTPVAIDGPSLAVTLTTAGQNAMLPFAGAAGQTIRFSRSAITIAMGIYKILNPDGSVLTSSGLTGAYDGSESATLPSDGVYTAVVDGYNEKTGTATVALAITGDAPLDNAQVACGGVVRAEPVAGVTQYQFQYSTDSGFTSVVHDSGFVPATNTYQPPAGALANNATYYWRWRTSTGSWSSARVFQTKRPLLGARDYWPMWSYGPPAVNQANGNLVVALPGPSYPTVAGAMGVSLAYNSLDSGNRGLGAGWALAGGDERADPPAYLLNHHLLTGAAKLDAVEAVYSDGSSTCFTHVGQTNTYLPEAGDGSQLTENADGSWTLVDGTGIYTFSVPSGTTGTATLTGVEYVDAAAGKGKLTYAYSSQDPAKLTAITDEAGRSLTLTWNSLNPSGCADAIVCITGPDGISWRYKGDGAGGTSGRLARVHNGTRDLFAVAYDASGRVNKLQNANDLNPSAASPGYDGTHSVTVAYDGSGRVASISDGPISGQPPSTSTWSFAYTAGPASTTPTRAAHEGIDAGTARSASGYTTLTPPRQQGQPAPKVVKTYYDDLGHPIEVVDQLGNITMAGYNARDQLLWSEDEDGNPTDHSYDAVNDVLLSVTGPDPDGAGPLGRPTTSYRYDEKTIGTASTPGAALEGLQASYFDNATLAGRPAARQTDASVDFNWASGGPSALAGRSDNFSVRWSGNVVVPTAGSYTFSTAADEGTRLTIDGVQAINNWKDQTLATVSSQPITLTAGTHKLVLEYYEKTGPAEVHLRWSCTACSPAIGDQVIPTTALRPAWLNQTSSVSPLGKVAFSHYADPAGARPDYTLAKLADGTNVITSFSYDAWGRVTQKVMPKGNAARTIDSNGNLQGSPDTTYATAWSYYGLTETAAPPAACGGGTAVSQAGLLKSLTPSGIAATTTVYDNAGRPIATSNGAGTRCRSYDAEGRLTSERAPGDPQATSYSYDPAGATRTAQDASGTITTEYDEAGRVKRSSDSYGAEATFAYDSEGNLVLRTAAAGPLASSPNYQTSYGYDDEGKLTSVTDPASRTYTFSYDSRGNPKTTQYPNGTFSWADYNAAGALTGLHNRHGTLPAPLPSSVPADSQGSPLADFTYGYDLEGRKTQATRTGAGLTTETESYVYDALGRLAQVTLPSGVVRSYSFDLDSNRTAIAEDGTTVASYTYDIAQTPGVDQLTSVTEAGSTRAFTYDSDGNVTARGTDTLTWDGWGRHTGGTFAGATVSYGFDALGFRRSRSASGATTRYLHGGLFETDGSGTLTLADVDGPTGDLARYTGSPASGTPVNFLYYNGHGDLAATADATGARINAYTYDPFGALRTGTAGTGTSERWTGRWDKKLDSTSQLVEMGARPYDPAIGRLLAVDPVEGGALNNYDYAGQDPVNLYDLDGKCICLKKRVGNALRYVNKHKRQIGVLVATTVAVAVVMSVAPVAAPALIATAVRLAVAAAGPLKVGSDMYQRTAGAPGKARATAMAAALAEPHIARMTPRLIQRAYFAATVGLRQLRSGV